MINGNDSGLFIYLMDSARYITYATGITSYVKDNNFFLKGKKTNWHDLSLEIRNTSELSDLVVENNVFNIMTDVNNNLEIAFGNKWLRNDMYANVDFSNNKIYHRGLTCMTLDLYRRCSSYKYNEFINVLNGAVSKIHGSAPIKNGNHNVQYISCERAFALFGKYYIGDKIILDNGLERICQSTGYYTEATWTPNTTFYQTGDFSRNPFIYDGTKVFKCTTQGATGTTKPKFDTITTIGDTITDNNIIWTYVGDLISLS